MMDAYPPGEGPPPGIDDMPVGGSKKRGFNAFDEKPIGGGKKGPSMMDEYPPGGGPPEETKIKPAAPGGFDE